MGKIFCFQNSKYFKIILFILIFFSFCFSSYSNDVKKRAKNMNKMTKIVIKFDRIFKTDDIDFERIIKIGKQLKKLGVEFPSYSMPDSKKGNSKKSMWNDREVFLKMNQDFVDAVEDFIVVSEEKNKDKSWEKFKIVFDECQICHHKFARAKINLLED